LQITGLRMDISIHIKGHLDPSWQEYLEGLEIVQETDGTTRLSGILQDQSALYGVLGSARHDESVEPDAPLT
jgi:hypothetical protein